MNLINIVCPLAFLVVGLLIWVMAAPVKAQEAGKWMYIIGLFWLVYTVVGHILKL
jgi:hypothetical protein